MVWELAKSLKEIASNKEGLTWAYRGISIHHRHGRETLQQAGMNAGVLGAHISTHKLEAEKANWSWTWASEPSSSDALLPVRPQLLTSQRPPAVRDKGVKSLRLSGVGCGGHLIQTTMLTPWPP